MSSLQSTTAIRSGCSCCSPSSSAVARPRSPGARLPHTWRPWWHVIPLTLLHRRGRALPALRAVRRHAAVADLLCGRYRGMSGVRPDRVPADAGCRRWSPATAGSTSARASCGWRRRRPACGSRASPISDDKPFLQVKSTSEVHTGIIIVRVPRGISRRGDSQEKANGAGPCSRPVARFHRGAAAQIKIGVAGPMTGGIAAFGAQLRNGVEQAVADINQGGILGQQITLRRRRRADPRKASRWPTSSSATASSSSSAISIRASPFRHRTSTRRTACW